MNSRKNRSYFLTFHCFHTPNTRFEWSWLVVRFVLTVFAMVILIPNASLWAESFNVNNPAEFQTALNTAADNGEDDTINVAAGTYNITTTLTYWSEENHSLTITGSGQGVTVLDGGNTVQIAEIISTNDQGHLTVNGMTLQNGNEQFGGGLYIETAAATITVDYCEFNNNASTDVGGGVNAYSTSGSILVSNSSFNRNTSGRAAGLFAQTETGMHTSLTNCTFEDNTCTVDGGGTMLYPLGVGSSLTVENNHFENNQAGNFGGGCWSRMPGGNSTMEYHNNSFTENSTLTGDGAGTYIEMHSGTMRYSNNTYTNNVSGQDGGGAWIWNESGSMALSRNNYTGNDAANNGGGASVITDIGILTFDKNILDSNSSGNVGGGLNIATTSGTVNVPNNTYYNNSSSEGGGIYLYFDAATAQADVFNNILWHDTPQGIAFSGARGVTAQYSDIEGGTGESWFGTGCIDIDPLFFDPAGDDFRLTWANYPTPDATKSPCIDAGDPASPTDPDGTTADMGALYFDQLTGIGNVKSYKVDSFQLYPNIPNPFNPMTTIKYSLPKSDRITLKIYNCNGQEIETLIDGFQTAGEHQLDWIAKDFPSGVYFYRLKTGRMTQTRTLILLK